MGAPSNLDTPLRATLRTYVEDISQCYPMEICKRSMPGFCKRYCYCIFAIAVNDKF